MALCQQYPKLLGEARLLARYWIMDLHKNGMWLLKHANVGMNFQTTGGGWSLHADTDLAVPPSIEQPPAQVHAKMLVHVILFAFVYDKRKLVALASHVPATELEATVVAMCQNMMCPSATFAMCLRELMHPGLTQELLAFAYNHARKYGYEHTEGCFVERMKQPLVATSHNDHHDLIEVMCETGVRLIQTPFAGQVHMPCGVFLSCHATDHVLLCVWLVKRKSAMVSDLLESLEKSTNDSTSLYEALALAKAEVDPR